METPGAMRPLDLWSMPPDPLEGHEIPRDLYRDPGEMETGTWSYTFSVRGKLEDGTRTRQMEYAWTKLGHRKRGYRNPRGPVVVFLHGVPMNRTHMYEMMRLVAPFVSETIAIDTFNMGESTRVTGLLKRDREALFWDSTAEDLHELVQREYGGRPIVLYAADWGAGDAMHMVCRHPDGYAGVIFEDPVQGSTYPVSEIQAPGRAAEIEDETVFRTVMGAFDQTLVTLVKGMTRFPGKFNQWSLRDVKRPYMDVDYEAFGADGMPKDTSDWRLNFHNIRAMGERANILSPGLLNPYDTDDNPHGVPFPRYGGPVAALWGRTDHHSEQMMTTNGIYRLEHKFENARPWNGLFVQNADHFASFDQPNICAHNVYEFVENAVGMTEMDDVLLGYDTTSKGDERRVLQELRRRYFGDSHF